MYQIRDYDLFERDIDTFESTESFWRHTFSILIYVYSAYPLNNANLWFYRKVGEEVGEKALKGGVGSVFSPLWSANSRNPDVWSYRKAGKKIGKKALKDGVGSAFSPLCIANPLLEPDVWSYRKVDEKAPKGRVGSVISPLCSANSLNPDKWSYRKIAESVVKGEHRGGGSRKIGKNMNSKLSKGIAKKFKLSKEAIERIEAWS